MNILALLLFLSCAVALLTVPKKWATVPLLVGCCYMTLGQGIDLGAISLPIFRLLLLIGIFRVAIKGEGFPGGVNLLDKMMLAWSAWILFASFFHESAPGSGPIYILGVILNVAGVYFLIRAWIDDLEALYTTISIIAFILVPIALEMCIEKMTGKNLFSIFGGVPENVIIRKGNLRAQGPFLHPILAGTVGAVCIPYFLGIWNKYKMAAVAGLIAGACMVLASASSGPVMTLLAAGFAIGMWKFKHLTSMMRISGVLIYISLIFFMDQPPYYLISKIDISGGSTGWHRSFLIEQTIKHFDEWWLFGTDYTRHWMPKQGIAWSPNHTDITNYYIGFGVIGGFLAMALVIAKMGVCFKWVGEIIRKNEEENLESENDNFLIWCLGCSLFAHAVTGVSVAYFDQSRLFFWMAIAVIGSFYSMHQMESKKEEEDKFEYDEAII